jgi:hypothetical protein
MQFGAPVKTEEPSSGRHHGLAESLQIFSFDEGRPTSRIAERVWRTRSEPIDSFTSVAATHWEMVVMRHEGRTSLNGARPRNQSHDRPCSTGCRVLRSASDPPRDGSDASTGQADRTRPACAHALGEWRNDPRRRRAHRLCRPASSDAIASSSFSVTRLAELCGTDQISCRFRSRRPSLLTHNMESDLPVHYLLRKAELREIPPVFTLAREVI